MRHWTFGQKIAAGFALAVVLTMLVGGVAAYALRSVVASNDRLLELEVENLLDAERLRMASERRVASARGYLLTREDRSLERMRAGQSEFVAVLQRLQGRASDDVRGLLGAIDRAATAHAEALDAVVALRRGDAAVEQVAAAFEERVLPRRYALDDAITAYVDHEEQALARARQASADAAGTAVNLVIAIAAAALVVAFLVALILTRTLARQVGTAVGQVQSSSAELQATANQAAPAAKEQAAAATEVATTISELLATSRQIAESAQRVAQIAEKTAGAGRSGESTVERANESVTGIRRQVDLVVAHMLELGKKSQQIGSVLDIVSELAEQTNILAINATIEAAGAGDAGRRFAVVADEIRKLADRVAASTKEIRGLIDDVRSAVNTTVMATETGSKAVDAGAREFGEVARAFEEIASLVGTTTEAAREIVLSTKQQTSAVEQVNVAIANVAQAIEEAEAGSTQTLQTASELAVLSKDLHRLVQAPAA
jgi:methyl-accepting chemotaxis protein